MKLFVDPRMSHNLVDSMYSKLLEQTDRMASDWPYISKIEAKAGHRNHSNQSLSWHSGPSFIPTIVKRAANYQYNSKAFSELDSLTANALKSPLQVRIGIFNSTIVITDTVLAQATKPGRDR